MGVTVKHYYHENNTDIVFGHDDHVCPTVRRWQLPANQSSRSSAICKCSVQDGICRDLGHSVCRNRDPGVQNSARQNTESSVCQNRDKNAKLCTSQYATQSTRRCAVRSTGMRQSTTQRRSATLTTS